MHVGADEDNLEGPRQWNLIQFTLACIGTMSVTTFTKYPLNQYYGGSWSLICFIAYLLLAVGPILYLQMRVSCEHRRSQISLFSKYLPFTKAIAIAFMVRNLLQVLQVGALMAHMLSYIMLGLYRCDGKVCVGSTYMWATCFDKWTTPQCNQNEQRVRLGPTPEDFFLQNYVLEHQISWDTSSPGGSASDSWLFGGFPTWLNMPALELSMLTATWLAIASCVIFGPRIFGLLLYGIAPAALISFLVLFVYAFAALARFPYLNEVLYKLYGQLFTIMSLLTTQVDPYYYQPLEWGLLGSMVCMTQALQLWSGQWSSMVKWTGYGNRSRHVLPGIAVLVFGLLGQLPTILTCAFVSAGYDTSYLRLHLIKPYAVYFIIVPRILGMWGVHPVIMVLWFAAIFLLALISCCLLLLTTVDNMVDDLRRRSRKVERKSERTRCQISIVLCVVMYLLGILLITRSGIFFIVTIDYYIDLLLAFLIPFAAAAYFVAFIRTKEVHERRVKLTEKVIISVLYFFGITVSVAAFLHALITFFIKTPVPSYDGVSFPLSLIIAGWIIALLPIVIGFLVGIPLALQESRGDNVCAQFMTGNASSYPEQTPTSTKPGRAQESLLKSGFEAEHVEEIDPM